MFLKKVLSVSQNELCTLWLSLFDKICLKHCQRHNGPKALSSLMFDSFNFDNNNLNKSI